MTRLAPADRRLIPRARDAIIAAIDDLKEDVALCTWETQAVHDRLDNLEPTLVTLERERQRRIGVVKFLTDVRIWFVGFIAAILWAYHNLIGWPPPSPPHGGS